MPSDEELRKVAEDMRALARSLARDFWDGTYAGRSRRRYASDALRKGVRDAVHGATNEFRHGMRYGWGPPPRQYGPPPPGVDPYRWGYRPDGEGDPAGGDPGGGASAGGASAGGNPTHGYGGYRGYPAGGAASGWAPWSQHGWWYPWPGPTRRPSRRPRHDRAERRPAAPPPVRRKWDASLLAGALVVVFGVAWLVSGLGALHLATEAVLAAGLMLLGAGLIVTARTDWSLSRHAWPVVLGIVLVIGLFATSTTFGVTGALSHLSFGDMRAQPSSTGTVYGGFGQLTVDTRGLPAGSILHVESVAGETRIDLPPGKTAVVQGKVLAGQVCIDGRSYASGVGASSPSVQVPPSGSGPGPSGSGQPLTIFVHQLAGQIVVGPGGCSS